MTIETVEQIVALLAEYPVSEIAVEQDGQRLCVRKPLLTAAPPPSVPEESPFLESSLLESPAEASPPAETEETGPVMLTSTMVGLFHHATPLISYGALVAAGQVVGSIESMKVMNEVPAAESGRVVDVFVEEGAPVEYGQALFRLGPV